MINCIVCNKEFKIKYLRGGVRQKTCSVKCKLKIYKKYECKECNNIFESNGPKAVYCSSKCKEKNRPDKQKTEFVCKFCGVKFKRRTALNAGKFCSRECSGFYDTKNSKNTYSKKAFLLLDHKCNKCGLMEKTKLVVHHKDHNCKNNDISNLEILCANCHYEHHFSGSWRDKWFKKINKFKERIDNAAKIRE